MLSRPVFTSAYPCASIGSAPRAFHLCSLRPACKLTSRCSSKDADEYAIEYVERWTRLVNLEREEERGQFEDRINNTPDGVLEARGQALFNMQVERTYTDQTTGVDVLCLEMLPGCKMRADHDFAPGDLVLVRAVSADNAYQPVEGRWEGTIMNMFKTGMRIELYDSGNEGDGSAEAEVHVRVDKGFNTVSYERQKEALQCILREPPSKESDFHFGSDSYSYKSEGQQALKYTYLRDVLVSSEPQVGASETSMQYKLLSEQGHRLSIQGVLACLTGSVDKSVLNKASQALSILNPTQREAVLNAVKHRLALIHGPPGTGKTTTTAALVQAVKKELQSVATPVLVCAQSNTAVDKLVEDLMSHDLKILRLGNPIRVSPQLQSVTFEARCKAHPLDIKLQCAIQTLIAARDALRELQARDKDSRGSRVPGETFYQARQRVRSAAEQVAIIRRQLHRAVVQGPELLEFTFPLLVLDEGSQASEPEALIPFMKGVQQAVLIGDHKQLPPTIMSRKAEKEGLGVSLFERMMEQQVPSRLLAVQYRAHPALFDFPNQFFYEGHIQSGVTSAQRPQLSVPFPPAPVSQYTGWSAGSNSPVAFINIKGSEREGANGVSKLNPQEAKMVCDIVSWIIRTGGVAPGAVGVISPYAAQVDALRSAMIKSGILARGRKASDIDANTAAKSVLVSSVDGFQGREKDVIIFSTVRSNPEGVIGFLEDWRRLNVAITRAKRLLIVVGNMGTLSAGCPRWEAWMRHLQSEGQVLQAPELQHALQPATRSVQPTTAKSKKTRS